MKELQQDGFYIIEDWYGSASPRKIKVLEVTRLTYLIQNVDDAPFKSTRWKKEIFNGGFKILEDLSLPDTSLPEIDSTMSIDAFTHNRLADMYY